MQGYTELREKAAWIDLSAMGKIKVTGEDRARLLHAMTTNHVQQLQPGESCYAFFLNAQGRILSDVWILCFDDHFLLLNEPEMRLPVYEHLDQFIIADDVTLEDVTDQFAVTSIEGPLAESCLDGAAVYPYTFTGLPGGFALRANWTSLPQADAEAARIVRIENGRARYGEEITQRFLVQETGQMQAIHFTKGCYLGQEIVERVRSRGQVHRHLRRVRIEGTEVPAVETKLAGEDGKDRAEIVSAVFSPGLACVAAMAYVRTDSAQSGTTLHLGSRVAMVV